MSESAEDIGYGPEIPETTAKIKRYLATGSVHAPVNPSDYREPTPAEKESGRRHAQLARANIYNHSGLPYPTPPRSPRSPSSTPPPQPPYNGGANRNLNKGGPSDA